MEDSEVYERIFQKIGNCEPILDVGCGSGNLVNFLARKTGKQVIGVDISQEGFAEAYRTAREGGVTHLVSCCKADARLLSDLKQEDHFGAAVCVYVCHEIGKPDLKLDGPIKSLQRVWRVLKPGGKMLIVDFLKGHEGETLWGEKFYSHSQLETIMETAGFERISVEQPHKEKLLFLLGIKSSQKEV